MNDSEVMGTTTKSTMVDFVSSPSVAVMVSWCVAAGVVASVVINSVDDSVGVTLVGVIIAVAPLGRPETLKETACAVPLNRSTSTS